MTAKKICKVCGKEYECCKTERFNVFRWQDVACCPEHAEIYFERVAQARSQAPVIQEPEPEVYESITENAEDEAEDEALMSTEAKPGKLWKRK